MQTYQGTWYNRSESVANAPTDNWTYSVIEVIAGNSESTGVIRTTRFATNAVYSTSINGGAVQHWVLIADDSNVVHKTGNETIADDKTFTGNIKFSGSTNIVSATTRGEILDGYDLNGYTDPYKYVINGAKNLVNYPNGASTYATLEVEKINSGTSTQKVTDTNSKVFIRSLGGSPATWSAWRDISETDNLTNSSASVILADGFEVYSPTQSPIAMRSGNNVTLFGAVRNVNTVPASDQVTVATLPRAYWPAFSVS